jgi:hypothetical protein
MAAYSLNEGPTMRIDTKCEVIRNRYSEELKMWREIGRLKFVTSAFPPEFFCIVRFATGRNTRHGVSTPHDILADFIIFQPSQVFTKPIIKKSG